MPKIPYPEITNFEINLEKKRIYGSSIVEGAVLLLVADMRNSVKDILVACRCCYRYRADDGTVHTVLLHEEIQRNATPFDDGGLPSGSYEFPFSFRCPENLPPSLLVTGPFDSVFNCKVWYEIRAYVIHSESHELERKHLRTSIKFQRLTIGTLSNVPSLVPKNASLNANHVQMDGVLSSKWYKPLTPIILDLRIKHNLIRNIHTVKAVIKQHLKVKKRVMRQMKEYQISHIVATVNVSNGVPIKRNQEFHQEIGITPSYEVLKNTKNTSVAVAGNLDKNADPKLAPSTKLFTPEGIEVRYTCDVICSVMFSPDHTICIPFALTDKFESDASLPRYHPENKLVSLDSELSVTSTLPSYTETMDHGSLYHQVLNKEAKSSQADEAVAGCSTDILTSEPKEEASQNLLAPNLSRGESSNSNNSANGFDLTGFAAASSPRLAEQKINSPTEIPYSPLVKSKSEIGIRVSPFLLEMVGDLPDGQKLTTSESQEVLKTPKITPEVFFPVPRRRNSLFVKPTEGFFNSVAEHPSSVDIAEKDENENKDKDENKEDNPVKIEGLAPRKDNFNRSDSTRLNLVKTHLDSPTAPEKDDHFRKVVGQPNRRRRNSLASGEAILPHVPESEMNKVTPSPFTKSLRMTSSQFSRQISFAPPVSLSTQNSVNHTIMKENDFSLAGDNTIAANHLDDDMFSEDELFDQTEALCH